MNHPNYFYGTRLHNALADLSRRVADGVEYPDAHTSCTLLWKVDGEELTAAYDDATARCAVVGHAD